MPEKLQTIVFLVRHGETDSGYSQQAGIDSQRQLTDVGREQSVAVGRYLAAFQPVAVYSSPLDRCQETAKIIQSEISPPPPIILNKALFEVYSAVPKIRHEVGERGETIFTTILAAHKGEQVVAVTHQYIIGYIVADFLKIEYRDLPCEFADVYRLVFAGNILVEAMRLQPAKAR